MYLSSLRELALGSRLKALSDHFYQAVDEVYRACGAGIESRWFPVLRYLRDVGPTTVTDMALAIGQTHSAVVGSIIVTGSDFPITIRLMGVVALCASMTNIVSGFLITDRMLRLFKQTGNEARP